MGIHQSGWQVYDNQGCRKYLDSHERSRFLAVADQLGQSQRALCYVLLYCGCRISEALELTPDRFDAEGRALRFRTLKRRRIVFRQVPIPDFLIAMLQSLPTNAHDRHWPIHRTTAWRMIREVMKQAQIAGPMATCKGCRHSFGILAAMRNVPGPLVQKFMGHASLSTTAIYLDAMGAEERQFAERMWLPPAGA